MLHRALFALFALLSVFPVCAATVRDNPRVVLELFTSQGCASCPQADALLNRLSQDDGVIALAYHVDYWDYMGWADTFGMPENSALQRAYASARGNSRIYTPQLMVNGVTEVIASRSHDVRRAMDGLELSLPVSLSASEDMLSIEIPARPGSPRAMIWVVTYLESAHVQVERGENEGRSLTYTQVVTSRRPVGMWEPDVGAELRLPLAEALAARGQGIAILVQEDDDGVPGPILGAASFEP
jgi:hypothetical protein